MFEDKDYPQTLRDEAATLTAELLDVLVTDHHTENLTRAHLVTTVLDVHDIQLDVAERLWSYDGSGDGSIAEFAALTEVAAALTITRRAATVMTDIGHRLDRMPLTALRFCTGMLDYPKVEVITSVLNNASDDTITALEAAVLAAAETLSPGPLRAAIWRLWLHHDHLTSCTEGADVRAHITKNDTDVTLRRRPDGISTLTAHLTDLQGSQVDALIDEMADTVCPYDRRTDKDRRSAAYLALMFGETALPCTCELADCPAAATAAAADPIPARRTPLLQITVTLELLLGLTATPPTLADGTPLDPAIVYTLATDARWQTILTELLDLLTADRAAHTPGSDDSAQDADNSSASDNVTTASDTAPPARESNTAPTPDDGDDEEDGTVDGDDGGDPRPSTGPPPPPAPAPATDPESTPSASPDPETPAPATDPESTSKPTSEPASTKTPAPVVTAHRGRIQRIIGRGKKRPAAALPPRPAFPPAPIVGAVDPDEVTVTTLTAAWLTALTAHPGLGVSVDPTGHGPYGQPPHTHTAPLCPQPEPGSKSGSGSGVLTPPPGALTYRPSANVAAIVRALHRTCVFPGCSVPSARCELDHRIPFDHKDPAAGGWTICENLQPLCKSNHQDKTDRIWDCTLLPYGILLWTSLNGTQLLTMPLHAGLPPTPASNTAAAEGVAGDPAPAPTTTRRRSRRKKRPRFPLHFPDGTLRPCINTPVVFPSYAKTLDGKVDLVKCTDRTWWETHHDSDAAAPTLADLAAAIAADKADSTRSAGENTHTHRERVLELRRHYRHHRRILLARYAVEKCPY